MFGVLGPRLWGLRALSRASRDVRSVEPYTPQTLKPKPPNHTDLTVWDVGNCTKLSTGHILQAEYRLNTSSTVLFRLYMEGCHAYGPALYPARDNNFDNPPPPPPPT